ncbi:hypothetical protein [Belnapia rosea]|uniref:hypothetical protein n=1 Tax=Belnapia rosea TaxID=938405 RepID=UPI0015A1D9AE|nr:hypothetical protein [Belnapia rosea]
MTQALHLPKLLPLLLLLAACGADYSPDTYATRAVQQANKVEQGMVVGRREVSVTAEGSTGAATGAAAGGVLGAQTPGGGIGSALGGVGGALIGGLIGTTAEHVAGDTKAFEYVVRTGKSELISVTQRDQTPLVVGQRVLVITGNQARIVPDYTTEPPASPAAAAAQGHVPGTTPPPAQSVAPAATPAATPSATGIGMPPAPAPPVVVPPPPPPGSEAPATQPQAMLPSATSAAVQNALGYQLPPVAESVARSGPAP